MPTPVRSHPYRTDYTALTSGNTLYVHLCSGEVVEIAPATAVRVTDAAIEAMNGARVVATFARDEVYFATDQEMEPPSFE